MGCFSHYSSANCSSRFQLVSPPHLRALAHSALRRPSPELESCWSSAYWFSPRKYVACCKWNLPSALRLPLCRAQQALFSAVFRVAGERWSPAQPLGPGQHRLSTFVKPTKTQSRPLSSAPGKPHFSPHPLQILLQTLLPSGGSGGGATGPGRGA